MAEISPTLRLSTSPTCRCSDWFSVARVSRLLPCARLWTCPPSTTFIYTTRTFPDQSLLRKPKSCLARYTSPRRVRCPASDNSELCGSTSVSCPQVRMNLSSYRFGQRCVEWLWLYRCTKCRAERSLLSKRYQLGPHEWGALAHTCFSCQTFLTIASAVDSNSWLKWYSGNRSEVEPSERLSSRRTFHIVHRIDWVTTVSRT